MAAIAVGRFQPWAFHWRSASAMGSKGSGWPAGSNHAYHEKRRRLSLLRDIRERYFSQTGKELGTTQEAGYRRFVARAIVKTKGSG